MSSQAAVFSEFQPKIRRSASRQSVEISFLDADSWVADVLQTLTQFEKLPPNWDSYGSPPPRSPSLDAARRFLMCAPLAGVSAPTVTPVGGGGIGFHWRVEDRHLEIEFSPSGEAEFLKCIGSDEASIEEGSLQPPESQRDLWNWLVKS